MTKQKFYKLPLHRWIFFYNEHNLSIGLFYKESRNTALEIFVAFDPRKNKYELYLNLDKAVPQPDYKKEYLTLIQSQFYKYKGKIIQAMLELLSGQ